jgi:cytochrome P450
MRLAQAPAPKAVPFFGHVLDAWKDPVRLLVESAREHGDFVRFRFGPFDYALVSGPEDIHHVLVERAKAYRKSRGYDGIKLVLGDGLLTSEGEQWRKQRKGMQPAFHHERVRKMAETMAAFGHKTLEEWSVAPPGEVHAEMMRLTFRIAGATLFGADLAGDSEEFARALAVALRFADDYSVQVVKRPLWLPTSSNRRFREALRVLDRVVYRIIAERRASGQHGEDLLGLMLDAGMSDRELRDEVLTLLTAGHETTAVALTWAIWLLAQHPDEQEKLGDDAAVERVVSEAMRLYPPAWVFERVAVENDVVGGFDVPAGTTLIMAPYVLHRSPKYWDEPEAFRPDRWKTPPREGVYLPFGDGPRVCIGKSFALIEAKILLGILARACRFELTSTAPVPLEPGITLRPAAAVPVRIVRR